MEERKPEGGKWTYDDMNREKYPKDKTPPNINYVETNDDYESAKGYIEKNFNHNPGKLNVDKIYPYDFHTADSWFEAFLIERYDEFGPYEDAVVKEKSDLNHSDLNSAMPTNFDWDGDGVNEGIDNNANGTPDIFESEHFTLPGGDINWPVVPPTNLRAQ